MEAKREQENFGEENSLYYTMENLQITLDDLLDGLVKNDHPYI